MAEASKAHSTPVADDWNWTARIRNELGANKAWQRNWGFLVEQQRQASQSGAATSPAAGTSADALSSFMATGGAAAAAAAGSGGSATTGGGGGASGLEGMSYIASRQRESARTRRLQQQDSLDGFVSNYMAKGDPKSRKLPAQEFRKPLTTSHDYGWGRNLEVFGQMTLVMK